MAGFRIRFSNAIKPYLFSIAANHIFYIYKNCAFILYENQSNIEIKKHIKGKN